MGPIALEQLWFGPSNPVVVEQTQELIQPLATPPCPAETLAFSGSQHMAPDLLFYPVLNETEALAGHGCSTLFIESVEQHGRGILSDG